MQQGLMLVIGGFLYIIAGILIYLKERNNKFDKGYVWIFFAISHGFDELSDGLNIFLQLGGFYHVLMEKVEVTAFMLSGTFLVAGFVSKVLKKNYLETSLAAILSIFPMIIIVWDSDNGFIDSLKASGIVFGETKITTFTLTFGVLATLIYSLILLKQGISLFTKWRFMTGGLRKKVLLYPFEAFMLIIYIISELLVPLNELFVIPEVFAIVVVVVTPQELILSGKQELQMYLVYEDTGLPILTEKFNPNIPSEILDLVTGFLTAINAMTSEELMLGTLDRIETENGILLSQKTGRYLFAMLVDQVNNQTEQLFEKLNLQILKMLETNDYNATRPNPPIIQKMESIVLQNVVSF